MSGELTLAILKQAYEDVLNTPPRQEPQLVIVSPRDYAEMEAMPGGPSWDNYMTLLKRRYGITDEPTSSSAVVCDDTELGSDAGSGEPQGDPGD